MIEVTTKLGFDRLRFEVEPWGTKDGHWVVVVDYSLENYGSK